MTANLPVSLWPAAAAFREEERSPMVALDDGSAGVWLDLMRFALGWGDRQPGATGFCRAYCRADRRFSVRSCHHRGGCGGAVPWFVVQARALMTELVRSGQEVITPGQVAAQVGVGLRTLQMGFRRFVGRSFGEDLREQRLHELHRLIAVSSGQDDVTTLMHACGIVSTGRFAGYYRERFGMLPSTQLRG
jgi:AraC-like DNA-binding protein